MVQEVGDSLPWSTRGASLLNLCYFRILKKFRVQLMRMMRVFRNFHEQMHGSIKSKFDFSCTMPSRSVFSTFFKQTRSITVNPWCCVQCCMRDYSILKGHKMTNASLDAFVGFFCGFRFAWWHRIQWFSRQKSCISIVAQTMSNYLLCSFNTCWCF